MPIKYQNYSIPRGDLGEAVHEYDVNQAEFIATQVLPIRLVNHESGKLSVITRESLLKMAETTHKNGGAFNRVGLEGEDMEYACRDYGLEGVLTDTDREKYSNDFDAELETVQHVMHKLLMKREKRVADLLFNPSTWTGSSLYCDYSGAPWDNVASDVISQVNFGKELVRKNTGMMPDSMLISVVALNNLLGNSKIIARFPGAPIVTEAMIRNNLAAIFGLTNLFVGKAIYDSAMEGQAFVGADIWSDDYCMIFKRQNGNLLSGGLGRTLVWSQMASEQPMVRQYREEQVEGDVFRVREYQQEKVFDKYFASLLKIDA